MYQKVAVLLVLLQLGQHLGAAPAEPKSSENKFAKIARYVLHKADWVSMGTISIQKAIAGYPFVSPKAVSDGAPSNSTGIPYLYLMDADLAEQDLQENNHVTIMATMAQTDYCKKGNYSVQGHSCPKVYISGKVVKVNKDSPEHQLGQNALFARHPDMRNWPTDHAFYLAKVEIEQIQLFGGFYGGNVDVPVKDYFNAPYVPDLFKDSPIVRS